MTFEAPTTQPEIDQPVYEHEFDPKLMVLALKRARAGVAEFESSDADTVVPQMLIEMADNGTIMQNLIGAAQRQQDLNTAEEELEAKIAQESEIVDDFNDNFAKYVKQSGFTERCLAYQTSSDRLEFAKEQLPLVRAAQEGMVEYVRSLETRSFELADLCEKMARLAKEAVVSYRMLPNYEPSFKPVDLDVIAEKLADPVVEAEVEEVYEPARLADWRIQLVTSESEHQFASNERSA